MVIHPNFANVQGVCGWRWLNQSEPVPYRRCIAQKISTCMHQTMAVHQWMWGYNYYPNHFCIQEALESPAQDLFCNMLALIALLIFMLDCKVTLPVLWWYYMLIEGCEKIHCTSSAPHLLMLWLPSRFRYSRWCSMSVCLDNRLQVFGVKLHFVEAKCVVKH